MIGQKLLVIAGLFMTCLYLTGCNTIEGMGKDMQSGGQQLQKAAAENR